MLFAAIILCLVISPSTLAQSINYTCQSAPIGEYATYGFCLPWDSAPRPGGSIEANYSEGREISTYLQLNDSRMIYLHLLYPCQIKSSLSSAEIWAALEAYDQGMAESASYNNSTDLEIGYLKAVFGTDTAGNRTFIAYQPSNSTVAVIFFDSGVSSQTVNAFLSTLHITVDGSVSPLPIGYCPVTGVAVGSTKSSTSSGSSYSSSYYTEEDRHLVSHGPGSTDRAARLEISQESLNAEREAAMERLAETKGQLRE